MIADVYRLSPLQEGMLFESLYAPEEDAYVVQVTWILGGDLDPAALRRAWEWLVGRHAVLRTSFHWEGMDHPHQVVQSEVELPWAEEDWRALSPGERERRLDEHRDEERRAGFDLQNAPLFRLLLVRLEDGLWSHVWTQHHLLLDGWSVSQVLRELFAAYTAFERGQAPRLPPARPFREYIEWLLRRDPGEAEAFWRRELAGFAGPTPVAPADTAASADRHAFGGRGQVEAEVDLGPLSELARRHRLTLNTLVQGAWALLLARRSGEEDVVFGVVVSGRPAAELPGVESAVGPFINTIPLRARLSPGERLLPWLAALQQRQLEARRFEHSPLVAVQGWSEVPRDQPLFESLMAFEGSLLDPTLGEGAGGVRILDARSNQVSRAPLTLVAFPDGERLHVGLSYDRDRFEAHEALRWSGQLRTLLEGMAADPERGLGEIPWMTEGERQAVAVEWTSPPTPLPGGEGRPLPSTIHGMFLAQAERKPDAVALVYGEERISYCELAGRVERLASRLRGLGVGPEVRVAVALPRSLRLVETLLAILQAGGAYVPLDPDDPPERREWIAEDCGAALVLTEEWDGWGRPSPGREGGDGRGDGGEVSLAYVLYTSGTTGRPKGAMVTHAAAVNNLRWAQSAYGLRPGDAALLKTPISFDVSVRELFWPLSVGARVVIARPGGERDPAYLLGLIEREGVRIASFVPSLLAAVLDQPSLPRLETVIAGGEALTPDLAGRVLERLPEAALFNHYGPTETAVNATAWRVRPGERPIPIGRPIANVRIDLLDAWDGPAPIGVAGELCIGGAGVGRGYLGRPDLTAEKFVPDPREPGARRYRTGDLARWRTDGALEFLGRIDHQVKVRGFRVEPGEIEAALAGCPGVREAAVVAKDGALVAFVAGPAGDLRQELASRLPAFLVPSAFVEVASLPRTSSGKVDRRALARHEMTPVESGFELPRTPVEEQVAGIWSEVLGRPRIGANDDFFSLGGHSLLALQVATRLREAFGVEIPLRKLFEESTPAALAREVETALRSESGPAPPPLVPVSRDREIPLSFSQESLWLIHQLDPASPAYNVPAAILVSGWLDPGALEQTLSEIVRRHEALRTSFPTVGGGPVQRVHTPEPVPLPVIDLTGLPGGRKEAERLALDDALRPFDLARGPLLRAGLVRLGEEEHLFLLTLHHAISDEWSVAVLVREVGALYSGHSLPDLPIQVADHAVWQREWLRGEVLAARLAAWKERLAGAPPVVDLPLDRPRTADRTFRGGHVPLEIPAAVAERLRAAGRERSASLFMVLLAGFAAWLSRQGAGEDLVIGVPVANRSHPGTEGLIGYFVNTLPLRADLSGDPDFGELIERARELALAAFAEQDLPFERLVQELRPERSLAHAPLFQVMLSLHNVPAPSLDLPGLSFRGLEVEPGTAKVDLILELVEAEGVSGRLEYAADLFDRETAERMAERLRVLLEAAAGDPERPVAELPILTAAESRQIAAWSRPAASFPSACLHRLFEAWAAERPEAIAVANLTYAELERRANRLARYLRRLGLGPETRVALRHERTPGLIVGLLGILKAGGAYVPIDPAWPEERLRLIQEDAGAAVLVDEELISRSAQESDAPLDVPVQPGNLAYVIYTSGSTGRPKGTLVTHANASRLLAATEPWFGFGPEDVWTLFHSAAFDFSVWEIWGALAYGGRLVLVPPRLSPEELRALLEAEGVTVLNQTPSAFRQLARLEPPPSLRFVIFGGEALEVSSVTGWLGGPSLINMYGITETTVHVTYRPLTREDLRSVGVPIPDLSIEVLDRRGMPVPIGVAGELCVGGAGVARGYLGRPDLTAERFVPAPGGARLYRSGDLGRRLGSGELEYLGRIDQQVKLRGFRIEPSEIEAALAAIPGVRESAVLLRNDLPAGPGLVAYVAADGPSAGDLLASLRGRLPEYMVPGHFVFLPALPLTGNGKLDRKALPAPEGERPELAHAYVEPRTPMERALAAIWEEALGVDRVGVEDNFFDLGGHSLLATQVVSRVREAFGVELALRELFERPTVSGLAAALADSGTPIERIPRRKDPSVHPLSFAQERLWFLDRLDPQNPAYTIPSSIRLRGRLDVAALERAVTEVVRRHETLRATFHAVGGKAVQRIAAPGPVPLPVIDSPGETAQPFRLDEGPLFRARLLRLGEDDHALSFDIHHIVADGWSLGVLVRELTALYAGETLPELPIQYADYAAWQRERPEILAGQLAWWKERLAGSPPSLDLPTDRPRPAVQTFRGRHAVRVLPADLVDRLRSQAAGASLFMVLLAGFQLLLSRWSGQTDVPVGSPIAGRTRGETEGLIGLFLNHLVLRTDLSGDPAFRELLARVREVAVGAYAHQDLPFEKLLAEIEPQRDLSRTPLFQVFFNMLTFPMPEVRLPGLTVEGLDAPEPHAKFDMTVYLVEEGGAVRLDLVYNAGLFDAPRMEEALAQYHLLLEQAAADPDARIGSFSLVTEAARKILPDPKAELDASWPGSVVDAVERHARETPDRLAVLWERGSLTYHQLSVEMNRIASGLEVEPGDVVAIQGHRSAPLVPAILGVLKAGAAFVILDPAYPEARNAEILRLARPKAQIRVEGSFSLSTGTGERAGERGPSDLAYLAFTSGSTGVPKGVLGLHRSLTHFYPWMSQAFALTPGDRFSLLSGLAHDPLHRDVFTPLWLGGAVVIPDPERMAEPGWLAGWMRRMGVTVANLTPAMGRLLTETRDSIPSLRRAFFVGDVLTRRDVERLREVAPGVACVNLYGSTETQRAVGYHEVRGDEGHETYPLGQGMPDVQLLVLTRSGQLAGIGEVGEIGVRSPHIAAGYLDDPALTAERFVINPFTGLEGDRLYRTGDLGRYRPDGEVEPLGRADFQVKIRGFRVELGEIEAALARHPAVREAVVVLRGETLTAYMVPEGPAPDGLRDFLRSRLPEYMVPSAFVFLDALPLTPNRKVDRRALPEPVRDQPAEEAPATPTEELLAGIWSEVLGVEPSIADAADDFFALGGHSLRVTQVLARVRETFGVELPVRSLFESPTLAGLAARIDQALRAGAARTAPPLTRVDRDGDLPLSFAQERLWFLDRLLPGSSAYNMPAALRLSGDLDPAALERTLQEIVRRHEPLRTTFPETDGEPRQRVHPFRPFRLPITDLRGLPDREIEAERLARQESARPFDLGRGPLLRARLLRLGDRDWVALLCTHHVVSDGWSVGVLVRETAALYAGKSLPELPVQYADFSVWQRGWLRGEALESQVAYWREALSGAPTVLDLPLDRPRVQGTGPAGHRFAEIPPRVAGALRDLARREGATLFMVLLAAFQSLLHRLTGEDDLVVGTPIANRTHPWLEGLIGFFVNTLALRGRLDGDPAFREQLARGRATALSAYAHQDLPFGKLVEELRVERSLYHAPVFQAMLVLQNAPASALELPGLTLSPLPLNPGAAKFDLSLSFVEGPGLRAALEYDAALFDLTTAERLLDRLGALLEGIATDPECRLSGLPVMGEAERHQVAVEWNEAFEPASTALFPDRIAEWASRTPDALAIGGDGTTFTFAELDRAANRVAHALREAGVRLETPVAASLQQGEGWALAFLGIARAGGVYVPIDPKLPEERRRLLLADCGASVLLDDEALFRMSESGPETPPSIETPPEALAYLIYTSGSTGVPKGVGVPHGPLARQMAAIAAHMDLGPGDRMLGAYADGFDASVEQMLAPLTSGAAFFPRGGELWSVPELAGLIDRWGITAIHMPTGYWKLLVTELADAGRTLPGLRALEAGGEAMPVEVARLWPRVAPGARLLNGYGPTETVITPTAYEVPAEVRPAPSGTVPIGRTIGGRPSHVADPDGQPVPIGVAGELWLGGLLARGYLGRPDLTAATFVPDSGSRLYRTGDRVRWLADGNLEYLGRLDRQVKMRGYRIELGEVEAALVRLPGVREAAVVGLEDRLAAFLVPQDEPNDTDPRTSLLGRLPEPMIPSAFVWLDALPLTATGKVDRRELLRRVEAVRPETGRVPPRNALERELAAIWEDLLGVHPVGARDDFFDLGGHSLLAVRLASRIGSRFGRELPIATLFERRTVEALADWLRPSLSVEETSPLVRIQPGGSRPPLFMVHPGGGGVLCYAELARALGPDQPLYGLQAPGLDGERAPLDRIEEMADLYIAAARTVQPTGRLHLGGWSFGGLVAYEMACRTCAGLVAILDVPPWEEDQRDEAELLVRGLDEQLLDAVPLSADDLRGLDTRAQVAKVLDAASRAGRLPADFDERRAVGLVEVFKANLRAARNWQPRPCPGRLTVFRAADSQRVDPAGGGWQTLAPVEMVTVPGDHHRMVRPPHVESLARALREALEKP